MLTNDLQKLEMQLSMLQCKDCFSNEDYELQDRLIEKIRLLKSQRICREAKLIKKEYSAEEIERAKGLLNA